MTIKEVHQVSGVEAGRVLCDHFDCRTGCGAAILFGYHNGYGEAATPPTRKQRREMDRIARLHERQFRGKHQIRMLGWHLNESRLPAEPWLEVK